MCKKTTLSQTKFEQNYALNSKLLQRMMQANNKTDKRVFSKFPKVFQKLEGTRRVRTHHAVLLLTLTLTLTFQPKTI